MQATHLFITGGRVQLQRTTQIAREGGMSLVHLPDPMRISIDGETGFMIILEE